MAVTCGTHSITWSVIDKCWSMWTPRFLTRSDCKTVSYPIVKEQPPVRLQMMYWCKDHHLRSRAVSVLYLICRLVFFMQPIQSEMVKQTTNGNFLQDFADECYLTLVCRFSTGLCWECQIWEAVLLLLKVIGKSPCLKLLFTITTR